MRQFFYIFILFVSFLGNAQNEALFNKATDFYNSGAYQKAIDNYLKILDNGQHSAELYFNLGNSYYKLNKVAPSIYYYEKALLLKPGDNEIRNNLGYAQNMTLDAIETMPKTGLSKIYDSIIGSLSFDQWAYGAIGLMLLFVLLYIAFYYLRYAGQKRTAFIAGTISLIAAVVCLIFAFLQYTEFTSDRPAIVFSEEISIKSEPNERSQEVFKLHEGTKVNVLEELGDFNKIRLGDGKTGWLLKTDIKLLKDF
ncbi:tetratricopeptide repeat protein [Costertonia aggregata]|uniref:Tetratricopeptide repeat protein n=1 Tax=Costertonia aggregata TaxID=343403 RepID=A0A7H9APY5_9FLAO|nr:tetratricopeptide repeat protein [Costertonia aggregata]QLG45502.1 tetratricopeptide repeat protein [Costertonia aggregata]